MVEEIAARVPKKRADLHIGVWTSLAAILLFFIASGYATYLNTRTLSRNAAAVAHTHEVITGLSDILSLLKDAETGQRGYVITGDISYLDPYNLAITAVPDRLNSMQELVKDNNRQQRRLESLRPYLKVKLDELAETIEMRRTQGFEETRKIIKTDRGKTTMDTMRNIISNMQQEERDLRIMRLQEASRAYRVAVISGIMVALLGAVLSIAVALLVRRAAAIRIRQEWLQSGHVGLADVTTGELRVEKLGQNILTFFCDYLDAHAGAFFVQDGTGFRRVATYGVPTGSRITEQFSAGDGLLGQAVKERRAMHIQDVPEGYLTIGSALGKGNPREILIAPTTADGSVNAVLEFGFIHPLPTYAITLLERAAETMGMAIRSANYRTELQNLLEETQRQSEELQTQSEELKVNNEELEEQSNALKASQVRMEQQQAELEQTNSQLEEQTQMLESQRDELARARDDVERKAMELEQASQYKSDFLANMSHELRTPLNSSLILAKLLADNAGGNLTEEQVKFAQTIQASGNDLLALINDILDLSKIEAGHMEVNPASLPLSQLAKDITRVFEPMAQQKGLKLHIAVDKGCPKAIHTDRLRLEQILKNLLSNAIKFTEKGEVSVAISCQNSSVAFAVRDTGIGIEPEQQHAVFDAFRQADSNINRKYGGTGLGLSISRQLARLLGGSIGLDSAPGKGSVFTLSIPTQYDASRAQLQPTLASPASPGSDEKPKPMPTAFIADDRESLSGDKRVILVVEDDESFARILYDLVKESGFQCLIANTAEDALVIARQYLPSAVLLDVGLPDHSGLSVLDRLKHDARTRHMPVHVVSANDHAQVALQLGAVGHMIKPVRRDELADALKKLEGKLAQRMRRVLIVEDDEVQRESVRKLLGTRDVETVAVGTAADCLAKLKETTFDCMVLDLSLPDTSGYKLLETLSKEDVYAFPPVIVYTGRELSADDEQQLRRYSKSIIIKGAKSPERLLDEVTLFLHQVVSELPAKQQKMLEQARSRDAALEGRRVLVVEDDVRNVYALTSILEPHGTIVQIARNGREALEALEKSMNNESAAIDLVLMDVMMPEMDGMTATRTIRKNSAWKKLPIIMLTAKAMRDDQERCLEAGANDYMAKPLDVEKLLSLVRVWMPR